MKKAVKAILNVLSYGGIEVESARRLADIKKLDPIRIFLRKLDMEIYNGDYKVPIRLFFPDEKMEEIKLKHPSWLALMDAGKDKPYYTFSIDYIPTDDSIKAVKPFSSVIKSEFL